MLFCPKCGHLLVPKQKESKKIMQCNNCNFSTKEVKNAKISEKMKTEQTPAVSVIDKQVEVDPLTKEKCPKCSHDKAYYTMVQTRAADEPETKFFKCEKCKHRWRDYS
tara:strand:+ start:26469 stop:26792 length:324 start_codon:yes stop_codon:yes gene_type:complete